MGRVPCRDWSIIVVICFCVFGSAVPPPLTWPLFLGGFGALLGVVRRRFVIPRYAGGSIGIPLVKARDRRFRGRFVSCAILLPACLSPFIAQAMDSQAPYGCFVSREEAEAAPIFRCAGYRSRSLTNSDGTTIYESGEPSVVLSSGVSLAECQATAQAYMDGFAASMSQYQGLQCSPSGQDGYYDESVGVFRECDDGGESYDYQGTDGLRAAWFVERDCVTNEEQSGPWYGNAQAVAWIGDGMDTGGFASDGFFIKDARCPVPLLTRVDSADPPKAGYSSTKAGLIQQYHANDAMAAERTRDLEQGINGYDLLTDAMKNAEQCIRRKFSALGLTYTINGTVRTRAYQVHLSEIWRKGYVPDNPTGDRGDVWRAVEADSDNDVRCTRLSSALAVEIGCGDRAYGAGHCVASRPAGSRSNHEDGNAVDLTPDVAMALSMKLRRGVPDMGIPPNTNVNTFLNESYVKLGTGERFDSCSPVGYILQWGGYFSPIDRPHFQLVPR